MSGPRKTFDQQDPFKLAISPPSTPNGPVTVPTRRMQNRSSENSNESDVTTSSSSGTSVNLSGFSNMTSPGTNITEPDPPKAYPSVMESEYTLSWFGLSQKRADQIWQRWKTIGGNFNDDFGSFTKGYLGQLVLGEKCDVGGPDADWRHALEQIGADSDLRNAILGLPKHDDIRLTKSALQWVEKAIEWRWAELLNGHIASKARAKGGIKIPGPFPGATNLQVHMQLGEDITQYTYHSSNGTVTDSKGDKVDFVPFWRCTTRLSAENMWSGDLRTGDFDLQEQRDPAPTDFSGATACHYWTPDLEGAQKYADYAKRLAEPAGVCLVRIEVPMKLLKSQNALNLRFPDDKFKRVLFYCRNGKRIEPKDLERQVRKADILVGDTSKSIGRTYMRLNSSDEIADKHLIKLSNGKTMTQFVFGHNNPEFEYELNKLAEKVTIRKADHPNILLPPMEAEALPPKKML